jgi:GT2 family glycosyltransferase
VNRPEISVVVPYFERQDQLDRLLAGLDHQTVSSGAFELVVADDGSPRSPVVGRRAYPTRVVRQPDDGFRPARARNLGAAASTGRVVVFLDQDCIPTPDYLRLVADAATSPWSLVVGHRLHADLDGWRPPAVAEWLVRGGPQPRVIPEPGWLLDGYARTAGLTRPDDHAYQLVLGAAVSLHRHLFDLLGGFDPTFCVYGGEDWDIGHRALTAGADLRWLDDAVVWHDGPDLAGRAGDLASTKNAETLALATRVPDPDVRGRHLVWRVPTVVVRLRAGRTPLPTVVASIESLLAAADAHVWVDEPMGSELVGVLEDPRVHAGAPSSAVLARSRYEVVCEPVLLSGGSLHDLEASTPVERPGFRMVRIRDANRHRRGVPWPDGDPWPSRMEVDVPGPAVQLERHWQEQRLDADQSGARVTRPERVDARWTSTPRGGPGSPTSN